ncbi:MAG: sulfatase [Planctomycetaceae bacterium]
MSRHLPLCLMLLTLAASAVAQARPERPNIILILCDNLGYGDVGCYGSKRHRTPHVDRLAAEGVKLTGFYVASGVCSPSRAAILTGCYPRRVNMDVPDNAGRVLQPVAPKGLNPDEVTIAEVLKTQGYATTIIGKWHQGDQPDFLPTRQGFDSYFGIPYSDDMTARDGKPWPPLPLMRNEQVVEAPADRDTLTLRYTQEAQRFIQEHRDQPFFIYLPHAMPGSTKTPYRSEAFRGTSANGPWGDSVEEIDWSTGEIMKTLAEHQLDDRTLVVWTSDNGAPNRNPPQGSNAPLKGWGYDVSEGAMRMPCLIRWPGQVKAGVTSRELCTSMDLLPTFADLAGAKLETNGPIDGKDIWPILSGDPQAKSPHKAFYYYWGDQLQAVRTAHPAWKLYLPVENKLGVRNPPPGPSPAELYDLDADIAEGQNVAANHPDVVKQLEQLADQARAELGDHGHPGSGQRPAGWVESPTARVMVGSKYRASGID